VETVATKPQQMTLVEPNALEKFAADLRVIADERRLRILEFLTTGERCVCEITEVLRLSQPLVSYHLAVLREAGLVHDRRDAHWIYYSVNIERFQEIGAFYWRLFDPRHISVATHSDRRVRCS